MRLLTVLVQAVASWAVVTCHLPPAMNTALQRLGEYIKAHDFSSDTDEVAAFQDLIRSLVVDLPERQAESEAAFVLMGIFAYSEMALKNLHYCYWAGLTSWTLNELIRRLPCTLHQSKLVPVVILLVKTECTENMQLFQDMYGAVLDFMATVLDFEPLHPFEIKGSELSWSVDIATGSGASVI